MATEGQASVRARQALARLVPAARRLAARAGRAAVPAGVAGLLLWLAIFVGRLDDGAAALVVAALGLGVLLAPAVLLLDFRRSLLRASAVPERMRLPRPEWRPAKGLWGAVAEIRRIVTESRRALDDWQAFAKLVNPLYVVLAVAAFLVTPVLAVAALVGIVIRLA